MYTWHIPIPIVRSNAITEEPLPSTVGATYTNSENNSTWRLCEDVVLFLATHRLSAFSMLYSSKQFDNAVPWLFCSFPVCFRSSKASLVCFSAQDFTTRVQHQGCTKKFSDGLRWIYLVGLLWPDYKRIIKSCLL